MITVAINTLKQELDHLDGADYIIDRTAHLFAAELEEQRRVTFGLLQACEDRLNERNDCRAALRAIGAAAGDHRRACLAEAATLPGSFWAEAFAWIERAADNAARRVAR